MEMKKRVWRTSNTTALICCIRVVSVQHRLGTCGHGEIAVRGSWPSGDLQAHSHMVIPGNYRQRGGRQASSPEAGAIDTQRLHVIARVSDRRLEIGQPPHPQHSERASVKSMACPACERAKCTSRLSHSRMRWNLQDGCNIRNRGWVY